ncbi:MAG: hypothetical protein JSV46_05625 [Candidatus Aminicenantes bacterium]|nr:MAG: hypothetical protein JSV46_05625 [Candidatus Aminicenantes bacterium]
MKGRIYTFFIFLCILGFAAQSMAQFYPEEIAKRAQWEELLKKGKIVKSEKLGQGVTKPRRLYLKKIEEEGSGVWKCPTSTAAGIYDKWQCEIAAYELDKLLELNMVPPTVERRYRGRKGSFQQYCDLPMSEQKRRNENIPYPPEKAEQIEKMIFLSRAFDSLIANVDRSLQNIRYTPDWRLILIDHSRAFRSSKDHREQLMYGKYGRRKPLGFSKLPRKFVEKVKTLNYSSIKRAVGFYLSSEEINAILARKELLLKEIEEMIQERGEDDVLY